MSKAQDIRELLAEQGADPDEQRSLERLADALDETLSQPVPHRPEFRAALREQLVAEARRRLVPWYRRPAVWGPALGVAAAALVMAVGLRLWLDGPVPDLGGTNIAERSEPPDGGEIDPGPGIQVTPEPVAHLSLPTVPVPDEVLSPEVPGPESIADVRWQEGLRVYQVFGRPDRGQVDAMGRALGFARPVAQTADGFRLEEDGRRLRVSADGRVTYEDRSPAAPGGRIDEGQALQAARRFLDTTALPMPSQPTVSSVLDPEEGRTLFVVTYTPRVEGRPVVNARTVIRVDTAGRVVTAQAFVQANERELGRYAVIGPDEAVKRARERGGATFDTVDLVYVRTLDGEAVYLQPYWRTFGRDEQGNRLARYVSALIPEG